MEVSYFTILYWFCHTSTWIRHRYTFVPHPKPPSLLPPLTSCIRTQLQHGGSSLQCSGAVQGSRARGLSSCSIEDSCFKACGISDLPPGIETTLSVLEGGLLIPGPPGTFQALFFPSTTAICSSPLYDLANLLIRLRGWSIMEDVDGLRGFAKIPEGVHQWLGL